ncbi:MAG TPA: DUF2891 domain-containing protein [Candidatus Tumulicola sp.]|nr:DUF2891 domain-containing protein [Candidatus Tumulicola sp.]
MTQATATKLAALALRNIRREFPAAILHVAGSKRESRRSQRDLHPSFYGCFDWHSSVETHWSLVRLTRLFPTARFVPRVVRELSKSFAAGSTAAEARYVAAHPGFERPYGLAWLLQLAAELHTSDVAFRAKLGKWSSALRPLERLAVKNLTVWLKKLPHPMRTGTHNQTAFSMGLMLDYARTRGDRRFERLLIKTAKRFYAKDRNAPLAYDLGGEDFLSPALGEADLMRRIVQPRPFAHWLTKFLPQLRMTPVRTPDRADGRLAHLDGLNISRAWMLEGIASGLPPHDARIVALQSAAAAHRRAGLQALSSDRYELTHWLGAYATYLETKSGVT